MSSIASKITQSVLNLLLIEMNLIFKQKNHYKSKIFKLRDLLCSAYNHYQIINILAKLILINNGIQLQVMMNFEGYIRPAS